MQPDIIDFDPQYREDFARLNLEWLERFFVVEGVDREVLFEPERHILAHGGQILFARAGDRIVGTCALKLDTPGVYELTKMAVTPAWQGQRIGHRLLRAAIERFKALAGTELFLESSSKLPRALDLYRRSGFELQPGTKPGSHYARSDVYMIWKPELDTGEIQ